MFSEVKTLFGLHFTIFSESSLTWFHSYFSLFWVSFCNLGLGFFLRFYENTVWKSHIIFSRCENDCAFSCSLAAWEFLIYYQSSILVLSHSDTLLLVKLLAFSSLLGCLNNKSIFAFTVQLITTRIVWIHCHRS